MKLTEQQLSQIFKKSKFSEIDTDIECLSKSSDASNIRIQTVENISNNSILSACYLFNNSLKDWTNTVSRDINSKLQPKESFIFLNWLKPTLATATLAIAVYFVVPQMNSLNVDIVEQQSKSAMFSGDFEKSIIINKSKSIKKQDKIYSSNFG